VDVPNLVLVGCQWGDEGKGRVTDLLAQRARVVVRFQGGPNAGHTLIVDDQEFVLHTVPSGILYADTLCVVGNGVVVDPEQLLSELDALEAAGHDVGPTRIKISDRAVAIMPYHRLLDGKGERERGRGRIGTTGRGIGPSYEDKVARSAVRMGDLLHPARLRTRLESNLPDLRRRLGTDGVDVDMMELMRLGRAWGERLREHIVDTAAVIHERMVHGDSVLFEGAQGTMLDIDHGTYPFVTSSNTVAGNACVGAGVGPPAIDAVLGVVKAYTTRVGEGPFPSELDGPIAAQLQKAGGEFGSTTGRPRRCGWFDAVIARRSAALNGLTGLVLTKLDVLSGLDEIQVATGYRIFDQPVLHFPCCVDELARCEPHHDVLPGWHEDITDVREFEDLPEAARAYVDRLEQLVGVPIRMISVGPRREQIIIRSDPFTGRGSA